MVDQSRQIVTKALAGGRCLTRDRLYKLLGAAGIPTDQSRGIHILWRLGQEAIVCFGPREGKQQTFTLLDEWVTEHRHPTREEALAEIALRYFTSHGPATAQDLSWWSGLKMVDVKAGIASLGPQLAAATAGGRTYFIGRDHQRPASSREAAKARLLPAFDEFLLSYKDRGAVMDPSHALEVNRGLNGIYRPIIVVNGRVRGTWMRELVKDAVTVSPHALVPFSAAARKNLAAEAARYGRFLGLPARLSSGNIPGIDP
jgi:hypothetical protein